MTKISISEYRDKILDPETDEEWIKEHCTLVRGESGFSLNLAPNTEKVNVLDIAGAPDRELENAMAIGNGWFRWRRQQKFWNALKKGDKRPVLVSEGDSWFQFPLLIKDTIDHLGKDYLIYSVGAAGDTIDNMVFGEPGRGKTEYMRSLRTVRDKVQGFLFSGAGNDIIGEDADGFSALERILRDFNGNALDIDGHINYDELDIRLNRLEVAYEKVVSDVRAVKQFENLPIILHGYDYVFPYPWPNKSKDSRNPSYAKNNEWLGEPLDRRGIKDKTLRRAILMRLIDSLYEMLHRIAGLEASGPVYVVDCRGAMPKVTDWNDEIHGTNSGFKSVAERFGSVIDKALKQN